MNTRRNADRRLDEELDSAIVPPNDEHVPPLEGKINVDQAPTNPKPMTEAEMRDVLAQMAQAMTNQAQDMSFQAQVIEPKKIGILLPVLIKM